jgi:hypothetical protein
MATWTRNGLTASWFSFRYRCRRMFFVNNIKKKKLKFISNFFNNINNNIERFIK